MEESLFTLFVQTSARQEIMKSQCHIRKTTYSSNSMGILSLLCLRSLILSTISGVRLLIWKHGSIILKSAGTRFFWKTKREKHEHRIAELTIVISCWESLIEINSLFYMTVMSKLQFHIYELWPWHLISGPKCSMWHTFSWCSVGPWNLTEIPQKVRKSSL